MYLPKMSSKRGQAGGLIGGAVAVVTVVVLLLVSVLLVSKVKGSIDTTEFTTGDNTTYDDIVSNSNTAMTLLGIALIVLVAGLIIAILRGGMA